MQGAYTLCCCVAIAIAMPRGRAPAFDGCSAWQGKAQAPAAAYRRLGPSVRHGPIQEAGDRSEGKFGAFAGMFGVLLLIRLRCHTLIEAMSCYWHPWAWVTVGAF